MNLILIPVFLLSGVDFGAKVGISFATGGIAKTSRSATTLGVFAGYNFNRSRVELGYSFFNFPGRSTFPNQLAIHELALLYNYEFFHRPVWGIALTGGGGFGFIRRSLKTFQETGTAPDGHLGLAFIQHEGKSRIAAGWDNIIFSEFKKGVIHLTYFPTLYVKVAYAF
ncbi:MAG: hypothetical protein ABIK39_00675 [candidate division WOR-3 bacterium]